MDIYGELQDLLKKVFRARNDIFIVPRGAALEDLP
jgi:hypothetical protein